MRRRPRAVWLIDSTDPSGATVMAARRMAALHDRLASTPLTVRRGRASIPAGSPLRGALLSTSLAGEVRIARADLVVTTSERGLASAAPRVRPGSRLVHFVHTDPHTVFQSEPIMRTLPRVTAVVVPTHVDAGWFARAAGVPPQRVAQLDDFTLGATSLLGTGRPKVVLAVGALTHTSGLLELVEAFRRAGLPGWQLRIVGAGPLREALATSIDVHGLSGVIQVLGPQPDLARHYLDAGVVVRLETRDAYGLPVLEALSAGVPVIGASTVPAVSRFVHAGNGVLLNRTDPAAIAEALVAVSDDHRRGELARGARENPSGLLDTAGRARLARFVDAVLDDAPAGAALAEPASPLPTRSPR